MISRVIARKPGNDNYGRLAKYIADASHEGEKCLMAWSAGCWAGDDYEMAIKEVEATQALNTRTRKEKTYHMMVSFRPEDEDKLNPEVVKDIELEFAKALGFEEHQRHCGVHKNTNNIHMHVAYNMIHPVKLTRNEPYRDYWKRDLVCRKLEKRYGLIIDNGRDVDQVRDPKRNNEKAETYEAHSGQQSFDSYVKERRGLFVEALANAKSWQDFQESLAEVGLEIQKRGNGCVFKDRFGRHAAKASSVGREFSKRQLENRLGPFKRPEGLDSLPLKDRYSRTPIHPHQKTEELFLEFITAMNAPRDTSASPKNWNGFLRQKSLEGDADALDVLRSKPLVGGVAQLRPKAPTQPAPQEPDYGDPLIVERFLQTATREITERLGLFEMQNLRSEIVLYASLREVPLKIEDLDKFIEREDVQHRFVVVPGSDPKTPLHTTKALMQAEVENREYLAQGMGRVRVNQADVQSKLDDVARQLFDFDFVGEQREAALGILSSNDFITCVQGDPGTGKTTMLKAVVTTHGQEHVIGLSTAGLAAKKLGDETDAQSMTIARFCIDYERRLLALESDRNEQVLQDTEYIAAAFEDGNGMLLVDEASMTSSMDANRLCKIAAREKAKVVLVGDTKQLPGVGSGKPFEIWQEEGAKTFRLSDIRRQKGKQERAAVQAVTLKKDVKAALDFLSFAPKSQVIEEASKDARVEQIIAEYMQRFDATGQPPLLITSLNKDRLIFNDHIRSQLKDRGLLDVNDREQVIEMPTGEKQTRSMATGDEIFFMRKIPGTEVVNGTKAKITNLNGAEYTVELESGQSMQFNGDAFHHFDHAYSLSSYKAQGQSVDTHVIYHTPTYSPLLTRNEFLVGISRNKHNLSVYTDSRPKMLEKAEKLAEKNTALDAFERGMIRVNGSPYLDALQKAVHGYVRHNSEAARDRQLAILKAGGKWNEVPSEERKKINGEYGAARDQFYAGLKQAASQPKAENAVEAEAWSKQQEFMNAVNKLSVVKGKAWGKAQSDIRKMEARLIAELEKDYLPGGVRTDWEPERKHDDLFERDAITTPEKIALFKEFKEASQARQLAFKELKEERERRQKELKAKWRTKRTQWKQNGKLLPRDRSKLMSDSKVRQLAEEERIRSEMLERRNQLRDEAPFIGWAGFILHKARQGDREAMDIWATMGDMMPQIMEKEAPLDNILDGVERQVDKRGNLLYNLPSGGMVKDNGGKIHCSHDAKSQYVAEALARRKFGPHFVRQGTNTMLAGRRERDSIVYTLAPGVHVRETENAISFAPSNQAAKSAALGLATRKFENMEIRINDKGVITAPEKRLEVEKTIDM